MNLLQDRKLSRNRLSPDLGCDYSTWKRALAGVVPTRYDAYYCNVGAGYIWSRPMPEGLHRKFTAYR